ncbi:MAG: carboxypeptidase regulatory-like domain-containing protein [Thermoplasmata archaeon]|nr:MAG: carboxypeptidase regulatory-like domain-containing protein [Thermoplasmata archaeon]
MSEGKLINMNNISDSPLWWEKMEEEDEIIDEDDDTSGRVRLGRLRRKKRLAESDDDEEPVRRRIAKKRRKDKKAAKMDWDEEEREISQGRLWLSQNWKTMLALFLIFLFGLFLRSYFYYGPATENGFILSGNDPYYHKRVVDYVQAEHHHLIFDPLLSYPDGALNPRPPMFDWSVAILGLVLSPLFGGDVTTSTWQVMEFSPAFWGALTAIPVYLIGKEMFNRKAGLICAFLVSTMPSHVERSPLGFSDHDAIVLFLVVLAFFFFIRALNSLVVRDKWVNNWMNPRDIPKGLLEWFKYNQNAVAFALFTGLSLASIALIWKGFLYPVVIIIVYFFIQLVLNKLRNKDSLGVSLITIIALAVVAFLPMPYYYGNRMPYIIEPASEILLAVIIISAVLVPTRDSPWLLVFSILAVVIICGFVLLMYVFPDIGSTYFSGQGYFAENKVFSTIAEAQAPDYSRAMFSYGIVTTFLALYAILISIIRVAKDLKAHYLFMTIWGITAVYMAISATRFIFNAGPIFAILAGWMVYEIIVKLDFRKMMKHYRSLKGGGRFYAMKKSVKVSHIVGVLFLVFMIFLPNIWLGWDAGVPFGEKKDVDVAVYDALPWFMKPQEYNYDERGNTSRYPDGVNIMYNRTNQNELKYFGAFGHGFPSDYWLDGMRWLSEQDTELPIEKRPAFISWWDYGFWAIYLGQHPTAADNFQGRVQYAGSFISAKNESQAQSLLIARIIEGDIAVYYREHERFGIHDNVKSIMVKYFGQEKADEVEDVLINPTKYKNEVLNNPDRYGYYSSDIVPHVTTIYAVLQTWIPEFLTDDERVWLLHDLQEETGYSLRYFAIDSRLFPYGPGNTGIYYAPLKLSDHRISKNNEPYDFLETFIKASDGREYSASEFGDALEANPNLEISGYNLKYYEPFLESMLMKCFIGYTLDDIGVADPKQEQNVDPNLPGVHATNYIPMPAWMMKHFQLVYRTAYWNPYNQTEYRYHPDAWLAMSEIEANELIKERESDGLDNDRNGEIDEQGEGGVVTSGLRSGVVFIKYYEGAYLNGTVKTRKGTPIQNARVTVLDEYGIPHDTILTDENGSYNLIACEGNVTVYVSSGGFGEGETAAFGIMAQVETIELNKTNIIISDDQVMRREIDLDNDGIWDYNIVKDFEVEPNIFEGRVFWDNNTNDMYDPEEDINISSAKVTLYNMDLDREFSLITPENGTFSFYDLSPGVYEISADIYGHNITLEETVTLKDGRHDSRDIIVKPGNLRGNITSMEGDRIVGEEIKLLDMTNDTYLTVSTDSEGIYNFDMLLPGNYTIHIEIPGYESYQKEIAMDQGNHTVEHIDITPATEVSGTVTKAEDTKEVANATIRFDGQEEIEGITKFAQTDENGAYSVKLRNGRYQIQVKHDLGAETPYVFLGEIDAVGGSITNDIALERTAEVYGIIYMDANENGTIESVERRSYVEISFKNSNGIRSVTGNFTGFYRVFLPLGDYTVYATYDSNKNTGIERFSLTQMGRVEYDFQLEQGREIKSYAYHDLNKNDERDDTEGLSYVAITITDDNGNEIKRSTDSNGAYSVNLPTVGNYTFIVKQFGFRDFNLTSLNITELEEQKEFKMTPINITLSGYTQYEGSAVDNVSISFVAVALTGGENTSINSSESGYYSLGLSPGEYNIIVFYNTTENNKTVRYLYEETIDLEIGEGSRDLSLNLTKNIRINGTINGTLEDISVHFVAADGNIFSELSQNAAFEFYLVPGEYTVTVTHPIDEDIAYVYLDTFNFSESRDFKLNLSMGVRINGSVYYDNGPQVNIAITFFANGSTAAFTDSEGGYRWYLPPNRTYEVTVNQTQPENEETVKYTFSGILDVTAEHISEWDIDLEKYIQVNGTVYLDFDGDGEIDLEEGMENIVINYEGDFDTQEAVTDEHGHYEAFLIYNETYNITLTSGFPILDEKLNITAIETETHMDIPITPENLTVRGTINVSGNPTSYCGLWFWALTPNAQNKTTVSDLDGNYSVDLSMGEYSLYARKVEGMDAFVYLGKVDVNPKENLKIDVALESGNRIYGAAYYFNSTYENLSAPAQLEFNNGGRLPTSSNDQGLFEVWLPSGSYLTEAKLTTFEYNMSMNYTYRQWVEVTDHMPVFMNLSKIKEYSVELEWIEGQAVLLNQNESVTYNISIRNTGNIEEIFDLRKTGVPDWNLTFPDNISLGIGEWDIFEVNIQTTADAKVDHGEIFIEASSRNAPDKLDTIEVFVNISQVYKAANLSLGVAPIIASNNTLNYTVNITNIGNGNDVFNLSLSGIPENWEFTLSETELDIKAGREESVILIFYIPYNTTEFNAMVIITAVSTNSNMTSTFELNVTLSNLEIGEDDLTVTGEDISEGALNREPIPGFEGLILIVSLLLVAFAVKRRRDAR